MTLFLLLAWACAPDAPPAAPPAPAETAAEVASRCGTYADRPSVEAWCQATLVVPLPAAEAQAVCRAAAPWQAECRARWVEPRLHPGSDASTEALLSVCDDDVDCGLDVVDFRPAAEIGVQLARCGGLGRNQRHCITHAIARWGPGQPQGALDALATTPVPDPSWVGYRLAELVVCDRATSCPGVGALHDACARRVADLRATPEACRVRTTAPGARGRP